MPEFLLAIEPTTVDADTLDAALRRLVHDVSDIYADNCMRVNQLDPDTGDKIATYLVTPSRVEHMAPPPESSDG